MPAQIPISDELALAAACCFASDADLARRASALSMGPFDWERFEHLLAYHGIGGMAGGRLAEAAPGAVPQGLAGRLLAQLQRDAVLQLSQTAESVRLCAALEAAGIAVLVLKGVALAQMLYAPRPERRNSSDIDLLIEPGQLIEADRVLCAIGYERRWPEGRLPVRGQAMLEHLANAFDYVHPQTGQLIELHHRMTLNPWCLPAEFAQLHQGSVMVETGAGRVRGLDGPVFHAYLCWHALGHFDFRLKWIADLSRMVERAHAAGCAAYVARDSRLGEFPPAQLCDALLAALGGLSPPAAQWRRDVARILAGMDRAEDTPMERSLARIPEEVANMRFLRRLLPGRRSRAYELTRALCDPRDARLLGLGPRYAPLYALLGPLLAAWRGLARRIAAKPDRA